MYIYMMFSMRTYRFETVNNSAFNFIMMYLFFFFTWIRYVNKWIFTFFLFQTSQNQPNPFLCSIPYQKTKLKKFLLHSNNLCSFQNANYLSQSVEITCLQRREKNLLAISLLASRPGASLYQLYHIWHPCHSMHA